MSRVQQSEGQLVSNMTFSHTVVRLAIHFSAVADLTLPAWASCHLKAPYLSGSVACAKEWAAQRPKSGMLCSYFFPIWWHLTVMWNPDVGLVFRLNSVLMWEWPWSSRHLIIFGDIFYVMALGSCQSQGCYKRSYIAPHISPQSNANAEKLLKDLAHESPVTTTTLDCNWTPGISV